MNYEELLNAIRNQNQNQNSSNADSSNATYNKTISQIENNNGRRQLNGAESALAGLKAVGDNLMESTGFNQKLSNIHTKYDEGNLGLDDIAGAVPNFLASIPAGMVAGLTETPAFLYEALPGTKSVTQAEQDSTGAWYDSDADLDAAQKLASGAYGAVNIAGLLAGGSGAVLKSAGNFTKGAMKSNLDDAAEFLARNASKEHTLLGDMAEEGLEEFGQSYLETIRGDENGNGLDDIKSMDTFYNALESGVLGAAGGGVMHGVSKGIDWLKNEVLSDTTGKTTMESAMEEANAAGGFGPKEYAHDGKMLKEAADYVKDHGIDQEEIPGVSSSTYVPGNFALGLDQVDMSIEQIRRSVLTDTESAELIYNKLIPENMRTDDTGISMETFVKKLQDPASLQDLTNKLNDIISARAEAVIVAATKEPSTNDSPFKFKLNKIFYSSSQASRFNPYVAGGFNMDADGDKLKLMFGDDIVNRSSWAYKRIVDLASGDDVFHRDTDISAAKKKRVPFKKAYAYLNETDEGVNDLVNFLKRLGITNINGQDITFDYIKSCVDKDASDNAFGQLLSNIGDYLVSNGYSEYEASGIVSEFMKLSTLGEVARRVKDNKEALKNKANDVISRICDIHGWTVKDLNEAQAKIEDKQDFDIYDYALKVWTALGFNINTTETSENPVFRLGQALYLATAKDQKVSVLDEGYKSNVVEKVFDTFFAMKELLVRQGEKPEDTIEGVFKNLVQTLVQGRIIQDFNGKVTAENMNDVKAAIVEEYNRAVEKYNDALKKTTTEGELLMFGVSEKQRMKNDGTFFIDFVRTFADVPVSAFFGNDDPKLKNITFMNAAVSHSNSYFDSSVYASANNKDRAAINAFMRECTKSYKSELFSAQSKQDAAIDAITALGKKVSDFDNFDNAISRINMFNAIIDLVGQETAVNLGIVTDKDFMGKDFQYKGIFSGEREEVANAIVRMVVDGQFGEVMKLASGKYDQSTANEIRYELQALYDRSEIHNFLVMEFKTLADAIESAAAISDSNERIAKMKEVRNTFLSTSRCVFLSRDSVTYSQKESFVSGLFAGRGKKYPMLASLSSMSSSSTSSSVSIRNAKKALQYVERGEKMRGENRRFDIDQSMQLLSDSKLELNDYAEWAYNNQFYTGDTLFTSFCYSLTTTTGAMAEKAKNTESQNALFATANLIKNGKIISWADRVTGQVTDSYEVADFMNNPVLIGKVLFDNQEITLKDYRTGDFVTLNRDSFYEGVVGKKRASSDRSRLSSSELRDILSAAPELSTMLTPQSVQMVQTADGTITTSMCMKYGSMEDSVRKFIESRKIEESSAIANYKRKLLNKFIAEPNFWATIVGMPEMQGIADKPFDINEFSSAVNSAVKSFVDRHLELVAWSAANPTSNKTITFMDNAGLSVKPAAAKALESLKACIEDISSISEPGETCVSKSFMSMAEMVDTIKFKAIYKASIKGNGKIPDLNEAVKIINEEFMSVAKTETEKTTEKIAEESQASLDNMVKQISSMVKDIFLISFFTNGAFENNGSNLDLNTKVQIANTANEEIARERADDQFPGKNESDKDWKDFYDKELNSLNGNINSGKVNYDAIFDDESLNFGLVLEMLNKSVDPSANTDITSICGSCTRTKSLINDILLGDKTLSIENVTLIITMMETLIDGVNKCKYMFTNSKSLEDDKKSIEKSVDTLISELQNGRTSSESINNALKDINSKIDYYYKNFQSSFFSVHASGTLTTFNTRFLDQAEKSYSWMRSQISDTLTDIQSSDLVNKILDPIKPSSAPAMPVVDFSNQFNGNLAGRAMVESSASIVATSTGTSGKLQKEAAIFGMLRPYSVECTEANIEVKLTPSNLMNYDGYNMIVSPELASQIGIRNIELRKRTLDNKNLVIVNDDNFRTLLSLNLSNVPQDAMITVHDPRRSGNGCNCRLCGGSPTFTGSSIKLDGSNDDVENFSALSDIIGMIHKFAMEPMLLKKKKTFSDGSNILPEFEPIRFDAIYSGSSALDFDHIYSMYRNNYGKLFNHISQLFDSNRKDLCFSSQQATILTSALMKDVQVDFGNGMHMLLHHNDIYSEENFINALIREIDGIDSEEQARSLMGKVTGISSYAYSFSELAAKISTGTYSRVKDLDKLSRDDVHSAANAAWNDLSRTRNFLVNVETGELAAKPTKMNLREIISEMSGSMAGITTPVTLEDSLTRMQRFTLEKEVEARKKSRRIEELDKDKTNSERLKSMNAVKEINTDLELFIKNIVDTAIVDNYISLVPQTNTTSFNKVTDSWSYTTRDMFKRDTVYRQYDGTYIGYTYVTDFSNKNNSALHMPDGEMWLEVEKALTDGRNLILDKSVYEKIEKHIPRAVRSAFKKHDNFYVVDAPDYSDRMARIFGNQIKARTFYMPAKSIGRYAEGPNVPDSSVVYNDAFVKDLVITGNASLSITLPDSIARDEKTQLLTPSEIASENIDFKKLDTSHLRNDSQYGMLENNFETFMGKIKKIKTTTGDSYNLEEVGKGDIIGIVKVMGNYGASSVRYIPITMNAPIPPNSSVKGIKKDFHGGISVETFGSWTYDEFCACKTVLRGLPYKAFSMTRSSFNDIGSDDLTVTDANGNIIREFDPEIVLNSWTKLFGGEDVDAIFDRNSLIKRFAGSDDTRIKQEFFYGSHRRGFNIFYNYKDGGIELDTRLSDEAKQNIETLMSNPSELKKMILNKNLFETGCAEINAALERLLQSCELAKLDISDVLMSYKVDAASKKITNKEIGYDFELVWARLSLADLFTIYNALDDSFCPPSMSIEDDSPEYYYDREGKVRDVNGNRIYIVTAPIELIDPKPHEFFGGEARLGMQFRGEQLMQYGLPNNHDELYDLLSYFAMPYDEYELGMRRIKEVGLSNREKAIAKSDFKSKWDSSSIGSKNLEDTLSFTDRSRKYKDWYDIIYGISQNRYRMPEIKDLSEQDYKSIKNKVANAFGVKADRFPDYVLKKLFCYEYGWEYGDGSTLKEINGETFKRIMNHMADRVLMDSSCDLNWIRTEFSTEGRPAITIFDPDIIDYLVENTKYKNKNKEELLSTMLGKTNELMKNLTTVESSKRIRIEYILDYMKVANGKQNEISELRMFSRMSDVDMQLLGETIGSACYGRGNSEAKARFLEEWNRSQAAAEGLAKVANGRKYKLEKNPSAYEGVSGTKRTGDRTFSSFLNNLNIIQKMMKFLHIDMPFANGGDRMVGTGLQKAMLEMSLNGFGPFEALRDASEFVPPKKVMSNFSKNDLIQKLWRAQMIAEINGDGFAFMELVGKSSGAALEAAIDEYAKKTGMEKAFEKVAYFASAGNFFMDQQIQNFIMAFTAKARLAGLDFWFETIDHTVDGETKKITKLEAMLQENPVGFITQVMTPGNPSFLIAQQALNFSKEGDKAQKNVLSLVYEEIFSKTTAGKFLFETGFCAFPTYKTNQIGNILGWVAPISSLHFIATKILINHGDKMMGGKFDGISGAAMTIQNYNSIREAMLVDATRMSAGLLATALFGLAAFQPPDDEDKIYNIDEWTIFGIRVCDEWWISDMLGLALPMAASWKLAAMGKGSPQLLINGIAKVCYNNPALRISDAVNCVLNPDITLDDFIDDDYYENSLDGTPTGFEWLAASWQALGLSYLSQFFTPSIARELYTDLNEFEVSTKKIYEENAYGHLTEDGANGKTMNTTFADQQLRKVCKGNPMVALICNAIFQPNTSYWAYDMPKTVYYDSGQIESAKAYSIYKEDGVTKKSQEELDSIFVNVYSIMNSYDDMEDLVKTGFYLDSDTKSYISTQLWSMVNELTNEYYMAKANGEFNPYTLGNGNYEEGYKIAQELQQAYWDDINGIKDFYYNKLWSEPMRRSMVAYNRYNTTYEQDANGNWYATGYRKQASLLNPFMFAAGTLSDPEDTAGYSGDWASLSAVNGNGMYDQNYNGMRALVAAPLDTSKVPDFDSWGNDNGSSSNKATTTNATTTNGGGTSYGSSGGSGSRGRSINSYKPNVNFDRAATMNNVRLNSAQFDYLRPSFETKGSRDAYKREDI